MQKLLKYPFIALNCSILMLASAHARHYPSCPTSHCSAVDWEMNEYCEANGLAGRPFLIIGPSGKCLCPCSCVIAGTMIQTPSGNKKVEELTKGALITQPGKNSGVEVEGFLESEVENLLLVRVIADTKSITVNPEHTFISEDGFIKRAEELKVGQSILDSNKNPIFLTKIEPLFYSGKLYNVMLKTESAAAEDHILITNGIQSGDFMLQTTREVRGFERSLSIGDNAVRTIGKSQKKRYAEMLTEIQ